jgi:hypothetical protein
MWWLLVFAALPEREVVLESEQVAISTAHDIGVDEGRLFWRKRGTTEWRLMPPDGLPVPRGRLEAMKELTAEFPLAPEPFVRPKRISRISADGDNLLAISDEGLAYYTKLSTLEWKDDWGPPGLKGPLRIDGSITAFAMSHRKIAYEDIDGNPHPVSAGVTTVYALLESGRRLAYADPWLPPGWKRTLCLPERNTFVASALAASASTLFVMDASGRAFTRLADFDTVGDDPALVYSWTRGRRTGAQAVVRSLPGEGWKEQPRIGAPNVHGLRLTILQTGTRNADRLLRVEGVEGVWEKPIDAPRWTFNRSGQAVVQPVTAKAPRQPLRARAFSSEQEVLGAALGLEDFDPDCSPATLTLGSTRVPLHFHGGLEVGGSEQKRSGALLLPSSREPAIVALRAIAGGKNALEVELESSRESVVIRRLPGLEWRFTVR